MTRDIELDIAGQRLKVRTDEDEQYMRQLASFVGEHMVAMGGGTGGTTTLNVALLTALRIADEFHKLEAQHSGIDGALEELASSVEAVLNSKASA